MRNRNIAEYQKPWIMRKARRLLGWMGFEPWPLQMMLVQWSTNYVLSYQAIWEPVIMTISLYIIVTQVNLAFWLVVAYDLLEDRRIDDESAQFKIFWILNLKFNQNSFRSIATNQFASFCIDIRSHQCYFCICQSGKILLLLWLSVFIIIILFLYCKAPPAPPQRSNSASFLRAGSRNGPPVKDRPTSCEPVIPREIKLTVPKASIAKKVSIKRCCTVLENCSKF